MGKNINIQHPYALINWNDHINTGQHKPRRNDRERWEQNINEGKENPFNFTKLQASTLAFNSRTKNTTTKCESFPGEYASDKDTIRQLSIHLNQKLLCGDLCVLANEYFSKFIKRDSFNLLIIFLQIFCCFFQRRVFPNIMIEKTKFY